MPRRKTRLTFTEETPELDPEERNRRIEIFVNTFARAAGVPGYVGCKYDSQKGCGKIFTK